LQMLQTRPRTAKTVAPPPRRTEPRPMPQVAPALHLLVRTPAQLAAAIELRPASITLDYLDLYGLRPSIERVKSASIVARVASPRVLKPGERRIIDFLKNLDCAILVRSAGMLEALSGAECIGDFSLNAANSLSAESYLALGLTRITPTHDLNAEQITALAQLIGSEKLETIAYQHGDVRTTDISQVEQGGTVTIEIAGARGSYRNAPAQRDAVLDIYVDGGTAQAATLDGASLPALDRAHWDAAPRGWVDLGHGLVRIKTGALPVERDKTISVTTALRGH